MSATTFASIVTAQFNAPSAHEVLNLLHNLKAQFPGYQHMAVDHCGFPLSAFLHAKDVRFSVSQESDNAHHQLWAWCEKQLYAKMVTGVVEFEYDGTKFKVYTASWTREHTPHSFYDLVFRSADGTDAPGTKLVTDIYEWHNALKDEIWVFQQGSWKKDKALWAAIQTASRDNIVLDTEFLDNLRRDTQTFFSSKDVYGSLGITWKRGLLLLGPPGNGKTDSIKVLLKESGQAPLYVKSFTTPIVRPRAGRALNFEHVRNNAPCILVIEDLDAMVTPEVRPFLLNELDGLGQNEGILTIATTNHPERIDDAILNRPSRFDVKYNFDLPTPVLRIQYVTKWLDKVRSLGENSQWKIVFEKASDVLANEVSETTDGWSYAFLKELFVSFLFRIAHDQSCTVHQSQNTVIGDRILFQQVEQLSSQIIKVAKVDEEDKRKKSGDLSDLLYSRMLNANASTVQLHTGLNF